MKKILVLFALLMTGVMGIHAQEGLKWGAMAGNEFQQVLHRWF